MKRVTQFKSNCSSFDRSVRSIPSFTRLVGMEFGGPVWVSHSSQGFTKGTIDDITAQSIVVKKDEDGIKIAAPYDEVFPIDDEDRSVEDHCSLISLNEASLLNNSKLRFEEKHIYTYVGNVLISINPYESINGLYSEDRRMEYKGKSLGKLPPHIYAIAEKARLELKRNKESQSIVVSGESGSGKTESQKSILSYLCTGHATPLQQRILDINPILEAFGNAKTMRNNNSSRFGKFVEVHFDGENVCGGYISHYLLERSRVTSQQSGERNYHIFYQLIAGADDQTLTRLKLDKQPHTFHYLNGCPQFFGNAPSNRCSGETLSDALLSDAQQFNGVVKALESVGLKLEKIGQVVSILAGILHLGNIKFIDDTADMKGGCKVDPSTECHLSHASSLLGVESNELRTSLVCRIMQPTKGGVRGTLIRVALKPGEAVVGRDGLAKAIYSRLFDWIVSKINNSIPLEDNKETKFIGVLDIAGFEFFKHNSFEQLCINYCNEKMQNFFAERVMGEEQLLYQRESIPFNNVQYTSNTDAMALFEGKGTGILDILDEEVRMPRPSYANFTSSLHKKHEKSFRLDKPRGSKEYRHLRDEDGFLVRHFAGTVCYETKEFIEKNKDELHMSLEAAMEGSSVNLLSGLFKTGVDGRSNINKLRASTIGSKFKAQLAVLLQRLEKTGTHFVRCIKPNEHMESGKFNGGLVLSQLRCAGIPSLLTLMHSAYPSRIAFNDLYSLYAPSLPTKLAKLESRLFCKCLFRALGLSPQDYAFGTSKVFFKSGKFAEFDTIVQGESWNISFLIDKTSRFLVTMRWKMVQYCAWSTIKLNRKISSRREAALTIQRYSRGAAIRRKYRRRMDVALKIRRLLSALEKVGETEMGEKGKIEDKLISLLDSVMKEDLSVGNVMASYNDCVKKVDDMIIALKDAEILRKQKEEEEKRRKEEEERERRMEEERALRRRIEEARQKEEEEWKKRKKEEERVEREEKEKEERQREEKERKRLDATLNAERRMEENVGPPQESVANDLSTWKYGELRDAINNSTDIEMLMACKAEFHRRLRVYNEWKMKTSNQNGSSPLPPCRPLPTTNCTLKNNEHRYFKIPLGGAGGQQGLLYIHFDGQWVGRQMEMRPGQKPALMKAGKDDGKMMHMSLEQSGLTRRKGAEIKGEEFDTVWTHLGGEALSVWKP
uniref:Myosin motor domain-containing protein n=1 Tax=Pristionchus pacificus TaxID=54126 RepID=A0A8R1YPX8_PRIPA